MEGEGGTSLPSISLHTVQNCKSKLSPLSFVVSHFSVETTLVLTVVSVLLVLVLLPVSGGRPPAQVRPADLSAPPRLVLRRLVPPAVVEVVVLAPSVVVGGGGVALVAPAAVAVACPRPPVGLLCEARRLIWYCTERLRIRQLNIASIKSA